MNSDAKVKPAFVKLYFFGFMKLSRVDLTLTLCSIGATYHKVPPLELQLFRRQLPQALYLNDSFLLFFFGKSEKESLRSTHTGLGKVTCKGGWVLKWSTEQKWGNYAANWALNWVAVVPQ